MIAPHGAVEKIMQNLGEDLDASREFKVQIPLYLHYELHRRRLLTGKSISNSVSDALTQYLERHLPDDDAIA